MPTRLPITSLQHYAIMLATLENPPGLRSIYSRSTDHLRSRYNLVYSAAWQLHLGTRSGETPYVRPLDGGSFSGQSMLAFGIIILLSVFMFSKQNESLPAVSDLRCVTPALQPIDARLRLCGPSRNMRRNRSLVTP